MNEPIRSPLLLPEENALLDQLQDVDDPTIVKLRNAVLRLASLKATEGVFPKYAAAIDEMRCNAFVCLLIEKIPPGHGRVIWNGDRTPDEHCSLLSVKLECEPTELFMIVRPCIRIARSVSLETRRRVADLGRLCVAVQDLPRRATPYSSKFYAVPDGESDGVHHHIWKGPIVDFLADEDGYGVHRNPISLDAPRELVDGIMGFGNLDTEMRATKTNLGIFLPSGAVISVDLSYPILAGEELVFDTGLVMARYTFKEIEKKA